jgi:WG containing repeat
MRESSWIHVAEGIPNGIQLRISKGFNEFRKRSIDKIGHQIIDMKFEEADDFNEGLEWVKINDKYAYIRHPLR